MLLKQYVLRPLSAVDAERLRAGDGMVTLADESPGYPCRACLRDAEVGEAIVLTRFDPFTTDSPYRSPSPVYVHAAWCPPWVGDRLPDSLTRRTLSVRAYDADAQMLDAKVIDGVDLDCTARTMLADAAVDRLHVHNAAPGCWAATITRP